MARLLVVEDSSELASLIAAAAGSRGHAARTATSGQAALDALHLERFDVAVVDLNLTDMDGRALLVELSQRGVPCVALGGAGRTQEESVQSGAQAFFEKPFAMGALLQSVESLTDVPVILTTDEDTLVTELQPGLPRGPAGLPASLPASLDEEPVTLPHGYALQTGHPAGHEELLEIDDEFAALAAQAAAAQAAVPSEADAIGAPLEPGTVPRLFLELARSREWGVLLLQSSGQEIQVTLEDGQAVSVQPSTGDQTLQEVLYPTFFWGEGNYQLFRTHAGPPVRQDLDGLRPWDFVFQGMLQPQPLDWLRSALPADRRLHATPQAGFAQHALTLYPIQAELLAAVDGTKSVADLLLLTELPEADALSLLIAFAHLGLVELRAETRERRISFGL